MASRAGSSSAKQSPSPKTPRAPKARAKAGGTTRARGARKASDPAPHIPRGVPAVEDDALMSTGAGSGVGFGRCGGRVLGSRLEQGLCDRLSRAGVAHSHHPRHFEVRLENESVAAYAPMVVLRGRGREGKSVVIEGVEQLEDPIMRKIVAFRVQYGAEFYLICVAPEEVLDEIPLSAYDESCTTNNMNTLISRLAE